VRLTIILITLRAGESLPVVVQPGGNVLMGSTVVRGELEALVAATGARTFFGTPLTSTRAQHVAARCAQSLIAVGAAARAFCSYLACR